MVAAVLALVLTAALAAPALGGDAVVVLQETRTRQPGRKQHTVQHVALVKNTSPRAVHGLRVTVELHDAFGKLLWTRTVTPGPARLGPGETASLSVVTPHLEAYKKTVYRFDYRAGPR
jgi:hypothetical protein